MGFLYRLDFPTGKSYIGATTKPATKRFKEHKPKWKKYGVPKLVILAIVENRMLAETEKRAITRYKTLVPNGYNKVRGGPNPLYGEAAKRSDAFRTKMSELSKGRTFSRKTLARMSKAAKNRPKMSAETKAKIVAALKRRGEITAATRKRMSIAQKKNTARPEWRAKVSKTTKRAMANPTIKAKHLAGCRRAAKKGKENPLFGIKRPASVCKKISETKKRRNALKRRLLNRATA